MKNFRNDRPKLGLKSGALAMALVAFGVTACQVPGDTADTTQPTTQQPTADTQMAQDQGMDQDMENVEAGDLSGDLEDYLGRAVSIRGEVVEVLGDGAFVIAGGLLTDDVVVFNVSGSPMVLPSDDITERVQVTGQVQQVVIDDINQQYGLTLDEETFGDYENNPAILAESIALAPEPGEVSDNPGAFYNDRIAMEGGVDEEYGPNVFTIGGDGFLGASSILVINDAGEVVNFDDIDDVVVLGMLKPFNLAELEQEYGLTLEPDARQSLESDYGEASVLVAEQVFPINR